MRDALKQGDDLLAAATCCARLLRAFEKFLDSVPANRRPDMATALPRELFRPFVDRVREGRGTLEGDVKGAAILLMAPQGLGVPRELWLAEDEKADPGPDVRRTLEVLKLAYPRLVKPPQQGQGGPPDDDRPPPPPDEGR